MNLHPSLLLLSEEWQRRAVWSCSIGILFPHLWREGHRGWFLHTGIWSVSYLTWGLTEPPIGVLGGGLTLIRILTHPNAVTLMFVAGGWPNESLKGSE